MDQSLKLFKREGKNNTKLDILGKKKKKKVWIFYITYTFQIQENVVIQMDIFMPSDYWFSYRAFSPKSRALAQMNVCAILPHTEIKPF